MERRQKKVSMLDCRDSGKKYTERFDYSDYKVDFLFYVFVELNEHIRATDEKNVLIVGSYITLIAVVVTLLINKINTIKWIYFAFSIFILLIGFCVFILQLWYRAWKEHYLEICHRIASNFNLEEEELLPFWLRKYTSEKFSADEFLLIVTFLINIGIIVFSIYLLWNLVKYSVISKIIVIFIFLILYFLFLVIVKQKLISKKFLIA